MSWDLLEEELPFCFVGGDVSEGSWDLLLEGLWDFLLEEELPLEEELLWLIECFLNRLGGSQRGMDSSDGSKSLRGLFFFWSGEDMNWICETESEISCA